MNYSVVFHVDSNDKQTLNLAFSNIENYYNAMDSYKDPFTVVLLANGPAVQLFVKEETDLAQKSQTLNKRGLNIHLCQNALNKFSIKKENLYDNCSIVPAGIVDLVELQNKGFSYIKP